MGEWRAWPQSGRPPLAGQRSSGDARAASSKGIGCIIFLGPISWVPAVAFPESPSFGDSSQLVGSRSCPFNSLPDRHPMPPVLPALPAGPPARRGVAAAGRGALVAAVLVVVGCAPPEPEVAADTTRPTRRNTPAALVPPQPDAASRGDSIAVVLYAPPATGVPDSIDLARLADSTLAAIRDERWTAVAALVHPTRGLTFAPYGYVDTTEAPRIAAAAVATLPADTTPRRWGTADGTGDPIVLDFQNYYERWIYDRGYTDGRRGIPGEIIGVGNTLINIAKAFPGSDSTFIEYHLEGSERYGGMDWGSLRLVYTREAGRWWLVGIVRDQWTI